MTAPEPNARDWKDPQTWLGPTPPLEEFVRVYLEDDNIWWVIGCGHHMNLFDAACDRIAALEAEVRALRIAQAGSVGGWAGSDG